MTRRDCLRDAVHSGVQTSEHARSDVFDYIEQLYNPYRRLLGS